MRWTYLASIVFSTNAILKHSHFLSFITVTRNIITTPQFDFHQFKSYCRFSLPNNDLTNESIVESFHAKVIKDGSLQNKHVGNYILDLYVKCQNLEYAHKVFDEIPDRDVRTWTILLSGFARTDSCRVVLDFFRNMQIEGVCPNQFTLSSILKCCSNLCELRVGKEVHAWILRNGIGLDIVLENSILVLYVKCEVFDYAERVFESMKDRDSVSWNIMLGAYLHIRDVEKSIDLFSSFPYKDIVSWNTIIDGLMRIGFGQTAMEILYQVVESGNVFNKVTFSIALNLASSICNMELGKQIQARVLRFGIHNDGFIRNSLIDMYCKCGKMEKASMVFRKMPLDFVRTQNSKISCNESKAEIVSWSSMVSGLVRNGEYEDALKTFSSMVPEQVEVDKFTLTSIVSACANSGNLGLGQLIHAHIQKVGHKIDAHLGSSLVDMYAKCGSLDDARKIFKQTNDLNVVLWTSMISGCGLHGQGREAVWLFECMLNEGITPNEVTFVGVLTACSHTGLLEEGCKYFRVMKEVYGITPGVEHFTCMVDLYGRAGRLNETKAFIHENGISHLSAVWKSFLSSCCLHNNVEMGKWVSETLLQLEPLDAGPYILSSNMFARDHSWEEAASMRSLMQHRGVNKLPGQSWIQLKNQVHTFVMGDRSHPQDADIYTYLEKLIGRLKEIGYSPDVKLLMQDVEEEQGELLLGFHSEKLAIAYGLISTACGTLIRIMKNLRVCTDCHNFIKYTSEHLGREIIVRDIHRFHHFKHGQCSCGDYW